MTAGYCRWQFHEIGRREANGGQVTLELTGWEYTTSTERGSGAPPVRRADDPCQARTVPLADETATACALVAEHIGEPYTPIWQGRGYTVDIRSGYPLWTVQG